MIAAFDTLAAQHAAELAELEAENDALRAQRDALLAALRDAEATISALYDDLVSATGGDFEARENTGDTLNVIRAAIAAAIEGE